MKKRSYLRLFLASVAALPLTFACGDYLTEENHCGDAQYDEACESGQGDATAVSAPAPSVIPGRE